MTWCLPPGVWRRLQVAACELYRQPLLEHLVYVKLRHWDRAVRELAAAALASLTPEDAPFVAGAEVCEGFPLPVYTN